MNNKLFNNFYNTHTFTRTHTNAHTQKKCNSREVHCFNVEKCFHLTQMACNRNNIWCFVIKGVVRHKMHFGMEVIPNDKKRTNYIKEFWAKMSPMPMHIEKYPWKRSIFFVLLFKRHIAYHSIPLTKTNHCDMTLLNEAYSWVSCLYYTVSLFFFYSHRVVPIYFQFFHVSHRRYKWFSFFFSSY